ncbi:MAG: family 10 glycosylhydrolase [Pyrinomonadaceae bacterium]
MQGTIGTKLSRILACTVLALTGLLLNPSGALAQPREEYRAFWVDTFNSVLNNHNDVVAVVNNAKAAKANAIFAQVRRRGDSWYLNSLEPRPDFTLLAAGFDPLQDLINEAHANGIEVHAFVIIGAVWNKNPTFAPSATLGPPTNPNHVFNLHGGYDPVTKKIVPGPNNWLTRTLLPDGTGGISFQGHRFGNDFWIDLGHPEAAAYTVKVLAHLLSSYAIDGLHLDRIRYPELSVSGQTPTTGTSIGYNDTSIARFNARYGRTGTPAPNDPQWSQWRRDQVTNFVRRLYLNAVAVKPQMKHSGAFIAFGGGPTTEPTWNSAEAYWRVYQDWRAWTEEGITDIAMPMNYKREHTPSNVSQYDTWNEWLKNHQYNRAGVVGQGAFLNSIEGTLRQTRRALAPSSTGNSGIGVIFFSMATSNVAVPLNPFSIPPLQNTPTRPFADFASGLTRGKSNNGLTLYEDPITNPTAIFSEAATIPVLPWKAAPTVGHIMGFAKRADNTILDTANVTIENIGTGATRNTATDGGGFFGGVDLAPGEYLVKAELGSEVLYSCVTTVTPGNVATADAGVENTAPVTTATLNPLTPDGSNDWYTIDVAITLDGSDSCTGVASTEYSTDGATWQLYAGNFAVSQEGVTTLLYRSTDRAGNIETAQSLTIKIDKTAPTIQLSADPSIIRGNNGKPVTVTLSGNGADAISGLASVSYVVTDEYGTPLSIPTRTLSGQSATWTDTLEVEARRNGNDKDGRLYSVTATITDVAGHTATATTEILVPHDQRDK